MLQLGRPGIADLLNLRGIIVFPLPVGTLGALAALVVAKGHAELVEAIVEFEAPSAIPEARRRRDNGQPIVSAA